MVQDDLGSVRGVVDNSVGVLWSGSPAPYGGYFDEAGTRQTHYGFTGEPMDDNGLLYLRARYYNPAAGVFTALDPFEGMWDDPMSINGYSYVHGNPVNLTDPSGECPICLVVAVGLAAVALTLIWSNFAREVSKLVNDGVCAPDIEDFPSVEDVQEWLDEQRRRFQPPLNRPEPFWYQPPQQQPQPHPYQPPTQQPCDPHAFAEWWTSLPDQTRTASANSNPPAAQWENSIARNSVDTFPGQFPKRIDIPGAVDSGLDWDTLDADGANRNNCRLVDAKYATSGYYSGYPNLPFLLDPNHENIDLLKRYRYALNSTPAVGVEIRINRSDNEAYWIAALGVAGFTYNKDGFVYVYPSANYPS